MGRVAIAGARRAVGRNRGQLFRVSDLSGGEASVFSYTRMPSKYSILLENCYISERGNVAKIPGYTAVNSSSAGVTFKSGTEYRKSDGTVENILAGGGKIIKEVSGSLTELHTGMDSDAIVRFAQMNDILIIMNGVDAPLKYDGSSVAALGGTPPATGFKTHCHRGRVWALDRTDKMVAYYTVLEDPEDWAGAGSGYMDFKLLLSIGDELLDMFTYIDLHVFVFRRHIAIYSGTDPTSSGDYTLVQLIETGSVSTDTNLSVGSDGLILNDGGLKRLQQIVTTGSMQIGNLSTMIDPVLEQKIKDNLAYRMQIVHYPRRSWILMLINDTVYVYSYTWKAWSRITGADIGGMFVTADSKLYLCGENYFYLYDDVWDFNGEAYTMRWESGWWPISKSGLFVYPKIMELIYNLDESTALNMETRYDLLPTAAECIQTVSLLGDVTQVDDVSDFDAWNPIDEYQLRECRMPLFGRGRTMQTILYNTSKIGPIEISDFIIQGIIGGF